MDKNKPNILLIFTDQQRLSTLSCYGQTPCIAPNLERLARESIRFETAYTTCPLCSPARGSIMTGLYPHQHGICSNVHNLGCSVNELPDSPMLLSRRLQQAGYRCGYTGKWHLGTDENTLYGAPNKTSMPRDVGFAGQNFPGHGNGGFEYPEYKEYLKKHGLEHKVDVNRDLSPLRYGALEGPTESTEPYFLVEHTISMIDRFTEEKEDHPFFIWHNFWGPHAPYFAPQKYIDMYRDVKIPQWPNYEWPSLALEGPHRMKVHPFHDRLEWPDWEEGVRHYYAFMTLIDEQIGRLLDHLDKKGIADNTLIIFTADHGETIGSHGGMVDKGFSHFEEIQRIPLLIRMPDGKAAGSVINEFVSLADIYPTILEAAGAELNKEEIHGLPLFPLITGSAVRWRDSIVVEFHGLNNVSMSLRTIRCGNYKYGFSCGARDELYDLEKDPHEMNNLIDDPAYSDILRDLKYRLYEWMKETGDPLKGMYYWVALKMGKE